MASFSQELKPPQNPGRFKTAARWHALQKASLPNIEGISPDLETVAEHWLDLIRPLWFAKLADRRKHRRPLLLKDLRQDLFKKPLTLEEVEAKFSNIPTVDPLDEWIAACIIGVPHS